MVAMQFGALQLDVREAGGALRLEWRGRSTDPDPQAVLGAFLTSQLERARNTRVALELHFEQLQLFNSATISLVLDFVKSLREARVPTHVFYAGDARWQRIFFDALRMFAAPGVLAITQVEK